MVSSPSTTFRKVDRGRRAAGYTLVILVVAIAILGILLAAALPSWSTAVQREKEQELIFRGMQYAEAIRVFHTRYGRLPTSLEELIQTRPRCIRKLWKDPMTKDGRWQLVVTPAEIPVQPGQNSPPVGIRRGPATGVSPQVRNGNAAGPQAQRPASGRDFAPNTNEGPVAGPIRGVYSRSNKESFRTFLGQNHYDRWLFTMDIVPMPTVRPESGAITRARSEWVGKPFAQGVTAREGGVPQPSTPVKTDRSGG